jgi:hypothetical protein
MLRLLLIIFLWTCCKFSGAQDTSLRFTGFYAVNIVAGQSPFDSETVFRVEKPKSDSLYSKSRIIEGLLQLAPSLSVTKCEIAIATGGDICKVAYSGNSGESLWKFECIYNRLKPKDKIFFSGILVKDNTQTMSMPDKAVVIQ